jgi:hypothetical protein
VKTATLQAFQQPSTVSWAAADCNHVPGIWRRDWPRDGQTLRDPEKPGLFLSYCVSECRVCHNTIYGAFTAWGTVREFYGVEKGRDENIDAQIRH